MDIGGFVLSTVYRMKHVTAFLLFWDLFLFYPRAMYSIYFYVL